MPSHAFWMRLYWRRMSPGILPSVFVTVSKFGYASVSSDIQQGSLFTGQIPAHRFKLLFFLVNRGLELLHHVDQLQDFFLLLLVAAAKGLDFALYRSMFLLFAQSVQTGRGTLDLVVVFLQFAITFTVPALGFTQLVALVGLLPLSSETISAREPTLLNGLVFLLASILC